VTLHLIPLDCPKCGSALHGASHDILFLCQHCGAGAVLEGDSLQILQSTALLPAAGRRADLWRPAWVIEARVTVGKRVLAGGMNTAGWSDQRTYVVPAFELSLKSLGTIGRALSHGAAFAEVPREPLPGGILSLGDALTMVRYLVVGDEVLRPDQLASVEVTVEPTGQRLAALPFERTEGGLRCAVSGVRVEA
jgi:hypothetical protein